MVVSSNPQIRDHYSPLRTLTLSTLRRFGDFSPESVSGEAASLFVEFANDIVDEWNFHPTMIHMEDFEPIRHYVSIDEARSIPDAVIRAGLLAYYAVQQGSEKMSAYQGVYYMTLNREAYSLYAGGNPALELRVVR